MGSTLIAFHDRKAAKLRASGSRSDWEPLRASVALVDWATELPVYHSDNEVAKEPEQGTRHDESRSAGGCTAIQITQRPRGSGEAYCPARWIRKRTRSPTPATTANASSPAITIHGH